MKIMAASVLLAATLPSSCKPDPEQAANKVFVESAAQLTEAAALGDSDLT